MDFFPPRCAPFLFKFENNINFLIKRKKGIEIGDFNFTTNIEHLWFKVAFDSKNHKI